MKAVLKRLQCAIEKKKSEKFCQTQQIISVPFLLHMKKEMGKCQGDNISLVKSMSDLAASPTEFCMEGLNQIC